MFKHSIVLMEGTFGGEMFRWDCECICQVLSQLLVNVLAVIDRDCGIHAKKVAHFTD